MTNTIGEIEKADVILITGSNTTENHPVLSSFVKRAVAYNNAKLIVIDPRRIKVADFAHHYLRPTLGTDVAWINGMMHVIIKENLHDQAFVDGRTEGFEALKKVVESYTPEKVEAISGIPAEKLIAAARMYAGAKAGSILYCMGITQHTTGTDNVKSLANLAMLCGNMGVEGGGVNPLRGQNNVQGACDFGGLPNVYSAYQPVTDAAIRQKMEAAWGVTDQPDFLNQILLVETHLSAEDLLAYLKDLENRIGREPSFRFGPRLVDIDIIFYSDQIISEPGLEIPHPRFQDRAFVLVPLAEISPNLKIPGTDQTISDLLANLDTSGVKPYQE